DLSALTAASAVSFDSVTTNGGADVLHWVYNPNEADLGFLKVGDTLTVVYTAQVNDGHGNVGAQPLTITIAGVPNDDPKSTAPAGVAGSETNLGLAAVSP